MAMPRRSAFEAAQRKINANAAQLYGGRSIRKGRVVRNTTVGWQLGWRAFMTAHQDWYDQNTGYHTCKHVQ